MTIEDIRKDFPILETKVYGKNLVYLDNSATSQRPLSVIEELGKLAAESNANIHRAVYYLSSISTQKYEKTREAIAAYINAQPKEIVFTTGTTGSINLVAQSFGQLQAQRGKTNIVIAESEHHSDIVPWQLLSQRTGMEIRILPILESGRIDVDSLSGLLDKKTAIVCVAHVSNVLGLLNPIEKITEIAHSHGVPVLIDGAQGIVHCPVDVKKTDCDFYAFSGHKIYASTGTGVLYAKQEHLEQMPPFLGGGDMIATVKFSGTQYAEPPYRFEAGTQNFSCLPTLIPALEEIEKMKQVSDEIQAVKEYVYGELNSNRRIVLRGTTDNLQEKLPIFSFTVNGIHHEDIAILLDKMGIAVRSGQMCCEPLMDKYGVTGMVRASFAPYNTMDEARYFISSLDRAIKMLE